MKKDRHIGAYAVVVRDAGLLVVRKQRGPYAGCLDLPGGGVGFGESPEEALARELAEETGYQLADAQMLRPLSHRVVFEAEGGQVELHHLALLYRAAVVGSGAPEVTRTDEDVAAASWVPVDALEDAELSPLVGAILGDLERRAPTFERRQTTDRIVFRPPSVTDADAIFAGWTSRPEATRYLEWATHTDVDQTRAFLAECVGDWQRRPQKRYAWVIARADDPDEAPVGMIELNLEGRTASVGYIIAPDHQGQGLATEALSHLVAAALDQPAIRRVYATADVDNAASARVMEKAGMRREGQIGAYASRPNLGGDPAASAPRDALLYAAVRR